MKEETPFIIVKTSAERFVFSAVLEIPKGNPQIYEISAYGLLYKWRKVNGEPPAIAKQVRHAECLRYARVVPRAGLAAR